MLYKECKFCGCALDPGEKCDCQKDKEKGLSDANQTSPSEADEDKKPSSTKSIAPKTPKVKHNPLRDLRISKKLVAGDMVDTVRLLYPKYDKSLQAKCENGDKYGVDLKPQAMDALLAKYAPELLEKERHRRDGRHRLKRKVMCRLEDYEYDALIAKIKEDQLGTVQNALTWLIRNYLKGVLNGRL